jgi:NAD(P)-dependent dehydrogenase (short-subunit alcohol dehydrogenase family)
MSRGALIVTGGSRGIGRATAVLTAARGWPVVVAYREAAEAAGTVVREIGDLGGRALAVRADVADEASAAALFDRAAGASGSVEGLVANAGLADRAPVSEIDVTRVRALVETNVVGVVLCCREAVRRMSTARGGRGGAIVAVSSIAALTGGRPGLAHHAATEGAVDSFVEGLAREVAPEGIRANVVRPGTIETDMTAGVHRDPDRRAAVEATIPMGRLGRPEEVAHAILWLLSEEASFVSGAILDVAGGGLVIPA